MGKKFAIVLNELQLAETIHPQTFEATAPLAERADLAFAQFVMLTPFPGTVDFARWEKTMQDDLTRIGGVPLTRVWLIPRAVRPQLFSSHPVMSSDEIRRRTQAVWDRFYSFRLIWKRAQFIATIKGRLAFVLISKLYRRMYAETESLQIARGSPRRPSGLAGWHDRAAACLLGR